uniref:Envelope protein n=1 Tax=Esox lucius TaxID=8010 RepID=A0AAY5L3L8_ESOLU
MVIVEFNNHRRPVGVNITKLFRLTYTERVGARGFIVRMQMILVQTDCRTEEDEVRSGMTCNPLPSGFSIRIDAVVNYILWERYMNLDSMTINLHNCSAPAIPEKLRLRDCAQIWSPIPVYELHNVSLCITGASGAAQSLGQSDCSTTTQTNFTTLGALPEQVYIVCGGKAYSCIPRDASGVCYMAYLVPLIRRADHREMAALYQSQFRHKRTLTRTQRIFSVLIPGYGTYTSQEEIMALSKVLERNMNLTTDTIAAIGTELSETRTVALQNRMALDMILASQGGVCKVVGSECCTYISDASQKVINLVQETNKGIEELHTVHGWDPFSGLSSMVGPWGMTIYKLLTTALAAIAFLFVCGIFLSCLIKVCVSKFATQVMVQQHVNEDSDVSEMFQFPNYWDDDIIKDHVVQEHCL